jgi:uncharacterized OsmC-like protein
MGIRALDMNIDLTGTTLNVTKHMLSDPRRIGKIDIELHIPFSGINEKDKTILQLIGDSCPVMKNLHPSLEVNVHYIWL